MGQAYTQLIDAPTTVNHCESRILDILITAADECMTLYKMVVTLYVGLTWQSGLTYATFIANQDHKKVLQRYKYSTDNG